MRINYRIPLLIGLLMVIACFVLIAEDELTVTTFIQVDNGDFDLERSINQLRRDQTGKSMSYTIQNIQSNTYELLVVASDVATNGYAFFHNITTNTDRWIDIGRLYAVGATQFMSFIRLQAGDVGLMRLHPTNTIYAQAGSSYTGAVSGVDLENWISED